MSGHRPYNDLRERLRATDAGRAALEAAHMEDALADWEALVDRLAEFMAMIFVDASIAQHWLALPCAQLSGRTPEQAIQAGRMADLLDALWPLLFGQTQPHSLRGTPVRLDQPTDPVAADDCLADDGDPLTTYTLDPDHPPVAAWRAFDSMTDDEREAAARSDPDSQPLTDAQLARLRGATRRNHLNLTPPAEADPQIQTLLGRVPPREIPAATASADDVQRLGIALYGAAGYEEWLDTPQVAWSGRSARQMLAIGLVEPVAALLSSEHEAGILKSATEDNHG